MALWRRLGRGGPRVAAGRAVAAGLLAAVLLSLAGCPAGRLALVLVFPDAATRAAARTVLLYGIPAVDVGSCDPLLSGAIRPETVATAYTEFSFPAASDLHFPALEHGRWIFYADVRGEFQSPLAHGCLEVPLSRLSRGDLEIVLDRIGGGDGGSDSAWPEAGPTDSAIEDGGPHDSAVPESGLPDSGFPDSGSPDSGFPDSGFPPPDCDPPDGGASPGGLDFHTAATPPTIDGHVGSGEWTGAATCTATLPTSGDAAEFYGLADATTIYLGAVIYDGTEDVGGPGLSDQVAILVDVNCNGGDPDYEDRGFLLRRDGSSTAFEGFGSNDDSTSFLTEIVVPGFVAVAYSLPPRWEAELVIPKAAIGDPPSGLRLRIGVGARDYTEAEAASCPAGLTDMDVWSWGYSYVQ